MKVLDLAAGKTALPKCPYCDRPRCPYCDQPTLIGRARVDSDDRIHSAWKHCENCGWNNKPDESVK